MGGLEWFILGALTGAVVMAIIFRALMALARSPFVQALVIQHFLSRFGR